MKLPGVVRFDGWALHRASGELVKGDVRVRLQSQPLAILEQLLARPGEVVTREELIARLWPRGVVDFDTALNSAVRRLRTALGDHAGTAIYIETIPKRGYRFIGRLEPSANMELGIPVERDGNAPDRPAGRSRWSVPAAIALSIAILLAVVAVRSPAAGGRGGADGTASAPAPAVASAPAALERLARARHLLQRRGDGDVSRAVQYLEQAVAIEPGVGPAWASLATAYWLETVEGRLPESQGLSKVREAAERALSLDPNLAEAHVRLANFWGRSGRPELGKRHFRAAMVAQPEHPLVLALRASLAAGEGRYGEAIDLQQRALLADPLSIANRQNLAVWLYLAGRIDECRQTLLELREIEPAAVNPGGLLSQLLVLERQYETAIVVAQQADEEEDRLHSLALAYAGLGRTAQADATLREMIDSPRAPDPIRVAEVYAYRGQRDSAFQWLWAAVEASAEHRCAQRACWPPELAERSPFLAPLRADPRWEAWTQSARRSAAADVPARKG
jgi:DNA-binding winged helix-turn-helix (wHTH) protein/tetratricopeptide (TPR) repeat protein